jgi:hypothetical protein
MVKDKSGANTEEVVSGTTSLVIPESLKAELEALPEAEREEVLKALAEDLRGNLKNEEPEFPVVKVLHSAALFEFPDESKVESFEGVIIEILPARAWWEISNSNERVPPDCSSRDWIHPEGDSPNPQAKDCASCSWNRWGSGVDAQGKPTRGKACRMRKRIFLQLKDHEIPFILSVPSKSLKSLATYMVTLSDQGIQRNRTITTFILDLQEDGVQTYSVIGFEPGEELGLASYLEARRKREAYLGSMQAVTIDAAEFEVVEEELEPGGEAEVPPDGPPLGPPESPPARFTMDASAEGPPETEQPATEAPPAEKVPADKKKGKGKGKEEEDPPF